MRVVGLAIRSAVVFVVALVTFAASPLASPSGASSATGTPIKIGYIASQSGILSSYGVGTQLGAQALIDTINKQGGYRGHPLQLVTVDDASSPTGAANGINLLISDGVFAIISNSDFFFTNVKATQQAGVPVMGGVIDGPEWGEQPYTNLFDLNGDTNPVHEGAQVSSAPYFKSIGIKDVGGLALGISPSSVQTVKDFKTILADHGMTMGYENLTIPYGPFNATPIALLIKSSGVKGIVCSCATSTFVNVTTALKSAGAKVAALDWGGTDPSVFATPTSEAAVQGDGFISFLPSLNSPAATTFEKRLNAVDPSYKLGTYPTYETIEAYLGVAAIYEGLQLTGSADPTQQSFISHMLKLSNWTGDGLLAGPVSFDHFGQSDSTFCNFFAKAEGKKFVAVDGGKPVCANVPPSLGGV